MSVVVDLLLLAIGVIIVILYAKRGFLKSLIHSMKTILAFVAANAFGGKLADLLSDAFIGAAVRKPVFKKVNSVFSEATESVALDEITTSFPSFIMKDDVKEKINSLEESGETLVNNVTDAIANPIANVISTVVGYILVFAISLVVLWILAIVLTKVVDHIKMLRTANILLGVLMGVILSCVLFFVVGTTFRFFAGDSEFYTQTVLLRAFGDARLPAFLRFMDIHYLLG